MADFDVFNGDADGICALIQLRNAEPRTATLVTGVKRDINLLDRVVAGEGDRVTVLDVSMDKNKESLLRILEAEAEVFYSDHHVAGDIPEDKNLEALINTAPDVCTSILVNGYLKSAYLGWAVVGAYGDNLFASAGSLARPLDLEDAQLLKLKNLGTYLNYNGYGSSLEDLHFAPTDLYLKTVPFADPFMFMDEDGETFSSLEEGYLEDMSSAESVQPEQANDATAVYILPDDAWARRVSGVYSNDLANENPRRGHAVLTAKSNGNYLVSVRAPLENKTGADELCMKFPTGGGRKAAAGINDLPADMLGQFIDEFSNYYV
jgi:hypothetical protein